MIQESSAKSFVTLTVLSGKILMKDWPLWYSNQNLCPLNICSPRLWLPFVFYNSGSLRTILIFQCVIDMSKCQNLISPYSLLGTRSKAFAKSRSISSTLLSSTILDVMKSSVSSKLLRQIFYGTKPCWDPLPIYSESDVRIILPRIWDKTND